MTAFVATNAQGNNIEMMVDIIARFVVIELSGAAAVLADLGFDARELARCNRVIDGVAGAALFGILLGMACLPGLAFVCFGVCRNGGLAFRAMIVAVSTLAAAVSALGGPAIFATLVSVKSVKLFSFLAAAASFLYDDLRHGCLLLLNGFVRAGCRHLPAVGSFYINASVGDVKGRVK